jgi:excisionase family DNA binding protein
MEGSLEMTSLLLKPDEAAEALQVSPATVYRMVARNELQVPRRCFGHVPRRAALTASGRLGEFSCDLFPLYY